MPTESDVDHGYSTRKEELLQRLRRIEAQVRLLERILEEDRDRIGAVTRIAALQANLDRVALALLENHARNWIATSACDGEPERLSDELMAAIGRLLRRGQRSR